MTCTRELDSATASFFR